MMKNTLPLYEDEGEGASVNTYGLYLDYKKNKPEKVRKHKTKKPKYHIYDSDYDEESYALFGDAHDNYESLMLGKHSSERKDSGVPDWMVLNPDDGGFHFGKLSSQSGCYVGKQRDRDGHIAVFGGSGSGKSSQIAIPTIHTWKGRIFAIDVKGELLAQATGEPMKVLYLTQDKRNMSFTYDPFYHLRQEGEANLVANARELAHAIIPLPHYIREPFWIQSARCILTSAIVYYYKIGLTFIDAMIKIKTAKLSQLVKSIVADNITAATACINPDLDIEDSKMLTGISEEIHNHIAVFATDLVVQDALTPSEDTITWSDLETHDIFIRVDQRRLDQWGNVIALLVTQLVRSLESLPEKYSLEGVGLLPKLLLLDEYPKLGKIDVITSALSTLRSKNVTIALFCQALPYLDALYGQDIRRIIIDNCSYIAILKATDHDTQRAFSEMIGTAKTVTRGIGANYDTPTGEMNGYSRSITESREPAIFPHELATLKDIVLITPDGFCRVEKAPFYELERKTFHMPTPEPAKTVVYLTRSELPCLPR